MSFQFSNASANRLQTVDPRLQAIANYAIEITKVDFGIPSTGGLRTEEEQNKLYHQGKSRLDGYKKRSNHQHGLALDVYAFVDGKASWEKEHLAMVAAAMLQAASGLGYELSWGGLWKSFEDYPHFQLED